MTGTISAWACVLALISSVPAFGDATVLLCEPYGRLGFFSPTGHMAVYLDRVCADSPTHLRRCGPGEVGAVVSRYLGVAGRDWLAVPLLPFLYAVDRAADVPASATPEEVAALRNAYREAHLRELVPDGPGGQMPTGNWIELAGAVYDRRIVAFRLRTTAEQDDAVIRALNARPNRSRFNFFFRNCADFTRDVLNLYFPKEFKRNFISDLSFTTPKHVAKTIVKYSERQPQLDLLVFEIPQIPGNKGPSRPNRGVMEGLLKKVIYVVPLAVVQPWIPPAFVAGYVMNGRFNPNSYVADVYDPARVEAWAGAPPHPTGLVVPVEPTDPGPGDPETRAPDR